MELSFDTGSKTKRETCPDCKSRYVSLTRYVLDRGEAFAACFIELHRHEEPEVYITATLGSWRDDDSKDHVTFACRYGSVEDEDDFACTLIDVPGMFTNPYAGRRLTRRAGLEHEKITEFWHVVDFILESDMAIHDFLFHQAKFDIKSTLRLY